MARHLTRLRMEQAGSAGSRVQASGKLRALDDKVLRGESHAGRFKKLPDAVKASQPQKDTTVIKD